jgi:hypothetical protein
LRKRSFDTASQSPSGQYPNKYPRPAYSTPYGYPVVPPASQPVQQWPGIPPSRVAPWPGQGPPPPGWNSTPPIPVVPVPLPQQWPSIPQPPVPPRPKIPRIKGTCFDFLEKGVCLRGAAVLGPHRCVLTGV